MASLPVVSTSNEVERMSLQMQAGMELELELLQKIHEGMQRAGEMLMIVQERMLFNIGEDIYRGRVEHKNDIAERAILIDIRDGLITFRQVMNNDLLNLHKMLEKIFFIEKKQEKNDQSQLNLFEDSVNIDKERILTEREKEEEIQESKQTQTDNKGVLSKKLLKMLPMLGSLKVLFGGVSLAALGLLSLAEGMTRNVEKARQSISDFMNLDTFRDFLLRGAPIKVLKLMSTVFGAITKQVAVWTGVLSKMRPMIQSVTAIVQKVSGFISKSGPLLKLLGPIASMFARIGALLFRFNPYALALFAAIDFFRGSMDEFAKGNIFTGILKGILEVYRGLVTKPLDLIKDLLAFVISSFWPEAAEWLRGWTFTGMFNKLVEGIKDLFGTIIQKIKDFVASFTPDWVKKKFADREIIDPVDMEMLRERGRKAYKDFIESRQRTQAEIAEVEKRREDFQANRLITPGSSLDTSQPAMGSLMYNPPETRQGSAIDKASVDISNKNNQTASIQTNSIDTSKKMVNSNNVNVRRTSVSLPPVEPSFNNYQKALV